ELTMSAEGEVGLDSILERRESKLLEPNDLRLCERLPREIGERCTAPERERGAQRLRRACRVGGPECRSSFLAESHELEEVDGVGLDDEAITGRRRLERAVGKELSQ